MLADIFYPLDSNGHLRFAKQGEYSGIFLGILCFFCDEEDEKLAYMVAFGISFYGSFAFFGVVYSWQNVGLGILLTRIARCLSVALMLNIGYKVYQFIYAQELHMPDILFALINAIEEGNIWVMLTLGVLLVLFKAKGIVTFWDERRRIKLSHLKEALACDCIKGLTRQHLERELESEYYRLATGFKAEPQLRDAITRAHEKCKGELRFDHFRRASSCFHLKNGQLVVRLTRFDKILGIGGFILGILFYLTGFAIFIVGVADMSANFMEGVSLLFQGGLWFVLGVICFIETLKYRSTVLVERELAKQQKTEPNN